MVIIRLLKFYSCLILYVVERSEKTEKERVDASQGTILEIELSSLLQIKKYFEIKSQPISFLGFFIFKKKGGWLVFLTYPI